jgi:glycosyltransferase involved in cell wall biosynthesis
MLSYDYARYIGEAIRSVLAQTYRHWELVVVDDASHDDSLAVIGSFDDPRIIVIPLDTRHGACGAYNRAYASCRGKYVGGLDADDAFLPEKLERQVALLEGRPDLDIVGTWIVQVDDAGRDVDGANAAAVNQPRDLNQLASWIFIDYLCRSSALLRKSSHDRVGGLNPDLELAPDFELWLRCLAGGERFAVIPERLTRYRTHSANVSHTHSRRQLWVELCFLFSARLAPLLFRRGRSDLLAPAMAVLVDFVGETADLTLRSLVLRRLADSPLLPRDFPAFRSAFAAACGDDWERVSASIAPRPAQVTATVTPTRTRTTTAQRVSIIDDYFPDLVTAFRVAEFNWYLEHLDCSVFSTRHDFDRVWREYAAVYPQWADRVRRFDPDSAADCSLLYCVFLTNAYRVLPLVERRGLPMVFTLYPGGGFELHNRTTDLMLSRVGRSDRLVKMIVTQRTTLDYVLDGGFVPPEKIELIWGLPVGPGSDSTPGPVTRRWPRDKPTFDICFVANKYMPRGVDKGYDTFVEVARRLTERDSSFRFHVVGDFGHEDVELGELTERITFYGTQPGHLLSGFFARMDVILSPNVRFCLHLGGMDGFPTGCCTEAALNGVAVLCTDPFGENIGEEHRFVPDEEICIIDTDPRAIVDRVMALHADPERLHRLARQGQARCRDLYGVERQLLPRLALLASRL